MGVFTIPPFTMTMSEISAKMKDTNVKMRFQQRANGALYTATLSQEIRRVESVLSESGVTLRDKITINGNTALHVAVGTSKNREFLEKMLNHDDAQPLDMVNSEGSTLLHIAAIVGNTEVAKMLIEKNRDLLVTKDNANQTPLARALSNMHKDTYLYLWNSFFSTPDVEAGVLFDSTDGCKLLDNLISSKDYGSTLYLIHHHKKTFLRYIDTVLIDIAQDFPPKLNFWERIIHKSLLKYRFVEGKHTAYWLAKMLLKQICSLIKAESPSESHHDYYKNAILEAARQNADKLVKIIVSEFPNAIWSTNEEGHNIIQYAVINRSERVYNLVYQMSEHRNIYRTIQDDTSGNNLLHLAARLAPPEKLDHISGAALRIQHELQWFKEVERFVCPLNIIQKNKDEETPQMVFTREHKELVTEGEKWMKETAQSYTITAALIITIVFAAAITVPGGNKQDNGIPVFANRTAFTIFAVSDAISLFTSVTSLLMFLSILTARFSEKDFLYKLPTKLIIGLTTLFISTTAMLVAFGATLFLVFGQNNPQILVPIAALTCLPIASFVTLQFPLIVDLVSSTYGGSIFGKKSDKPFY